MCACEITERERKRKKRLFHPKSRKFIPLIGFHLRTFRVGEKTTSATTTTTLTTMKTTTTMTTTTKTATWTMTTRTAAMTTAK